MELDTTDVVPKKKHSKRREEEDEYEIIARQTEEIKVLKKYIEFLEDRISNHLSKKKSRSTETPQ
jgi:formyltetrahydrofolate hydrolase